MGGEAEITVGGIFEAAGETMTGLVTLAGNFFTSLWAHPMGKISITSGLVMAGIALGYKIYTWRKRIH